MQSFILVGSKQKQTEYIQSFQEEHAIPSYFIVSYEQFKIAEARSLQKLISLKLKDSEKRLITIFSPTPEAQQALLKTIEELPERNFVFFLNQSVDDVLPTIKSRSQVIDIRDSEILAGTEVKEEEVQQLMGKLEIGLEDIAQVILAQRTSLINSAKKGKSPKLSYILRLKNLHKNYKLAKSNNINKKMILEEAFL